jgi:alpha-tubulin suppressor-like RCC1 family protein
MNTSLIKLQTVYSRGVNFFGQLGLNNKYQGSEHFLPIPGLEKVECRNVYASYAQSLCLLASGELLIWGWPLDVRSQMQVLLMLRNNPSLPKFIQRYSPFRWISLREGKDFPQKESPGISPYEDISIGGAFILASDTEGRGYIWGDNHRGQCGTKNYAYQTKPCLVESLLDKYIVKVSAGYQHSLFLTMDGEVYGTGRVGNFAFGSVATKLVTYKACITSVTKVEISNISDISAGQNHTLYLNEEGKVYSTGKNEYGQCGQISTKKFVINPAYIYVPEKAVGIACGTKHSLILGLSGTVYGVGCKSNGQIDGFRNALHEDQSSALAIEIPGTGKVVKVFAAFDRSAAIKDNGEVWVWGGTDSRYLDGEYYESMTLINPTLPQNEEIVDIGLGYLHTLVMTNT